ncbi:putative zinc-finger of transcription factor IIIC complex-domain-containing protein [Lenzites betulinus]|nr:putative zinc-finger of transcription factor IIIC complex-domain-containing protein [Lenzites betulinus]
MAEVAAITALSLPSVSISPSVNGLQFSEDGQAVLLTKYAVYILTPDAGVNVELSSVMKQTLEATSLSHGTRPLGWMRTLVEFDRSLAHPWPADCQDWGSVCLGSLDPSLNALALSPSSLTSNSGCVLALLNSNMELTIWGASHNFLTGKLLRLQDVTTVLKAAAEENCSSALLQTLRAQSTCIEWSLQPDWGLTPAPSVDASLLAVGNRAGSVTFLRFDAAAQQLANVNRAAVSDRWISHLAWSAWAECRDGARQAMLACGASDGSLSVLSVRQTIASKPSASNFSSDHVLELSICRHDGIVHKPDGRAITGMKWANIPGGMPILIVHKAGTLHLLSIPSPESIWSGSKVLFLRTQPRSVGSSALCQASGICYIPNLDISVLSLSDGSFHAVYSVSVDPTLDPPASTTVSSDALSGATRSVFLLAESEKMTAKDVDHVNGMTTYDDSSTFMWTYEASRPTDFSYKHDARHVSTLVVAPLWQEDIDERVIQELAERVGHPASGFGEAPLGRLRSILLHLRDPQRIARIHGRILDVLRHTACHEPAPHVVMPKYVGDRTTELSRDIVDSLAKHLFGWKSVQSDKMRYAVAIYCHSCSAAADVQQRFADAANHFASKLRAHFLLTVLRHLSAVGAVLNTGDIYFARRTIHMVTVLDMPPALQQEAEELSTQLLRLTHTESADADVQDNLEELCPACHAPIPLQDADRAICSNGHVWARCCITSLLLATPRARTCVGCTRKAFLPARTAGTPVHDAGWLPNSARGSCVLRDLLDATRRCLFCGNNFVTLV